MLNRLIYLLLIFLTFLSSCSDSEKDQPAWNKGQSEKSIRILAIGNSYSQDAMEQYLYDLFKAEGTEAVIGNMFIPGCNLETHWENVSENKNSYFYFKITRGEMKLISNSYGLADAIKNEDWDIITLQQSSILSWDYSTYDPFLQNLIDWIRENTDAKILFHQTWAYSEDLIIRSYSHNIKSQNLMYENITESVKKALEEHLQILDVIPVGTAIQNGRSSSLGDTFNRDGTHLEMTYGRFTAACTWYEKISGKSVLDNTYSPEFDSASAFVAKNAAHFAVLNPFSLTDMSFY